MNNSLLKNSKFLSALLGAGLLATSGLSAETTVIFDFEDGADGWYVFEGDQGAALTVTQVEDYGATSGTDSLALTGDIGGWSWAMRVDTMPGSTAYDTITNNYGANSEYVLQFDVTLDADFSGGYTAWHQMFVAMQSGDNWNQIDNVIDTTWEDVVSGTPKVVTATIPLTTAAWTLDTSAESLNIILSTNNGSEAANGTAWWLFLDNFRVTNEVSTGGDDYLGVFPVTDGWADTGDWLGWVWVENAPWVYSSALQKYVYVMEETFSAETGAWIYAPIPAPAG